MPKSQPHLELPLEAAERPPQPNIGRLVGIDVDGAPRVSFPGAPVGGIAARVSAALSAEDLAEAIRTKADVALWRSEDLVVVLAILAPAQPTSSILEEVLEAQDEVPAEAEPEEPVQITARVDGRNVVIEAERKVEIRCGESSIELRRDGRVTIRGQTIVSHAKKKQRIRGPSVDIN